MRTYQAELLFVVVVLTLTVIFTHGGWLEALGAAAVVAGFAHAQVSDRLAEWAQMTDRQFSGGGNGTKVHAACWRWSLRYFVTKETLWLAYFVAHRSWSALAGVGVFLAYPVWRKWYRGRK